MTCNAEYSEFNTFTYADDENYITDPASFIQVDNFYGDSLAAESGEYITWNAVGDAS